MRLSDQGSTGHFLPRASHPTDGQLLPLDRQPARLQIAEAALRQALTDLVRRGHVLHRGAVSALRGLSGHLKAGALLHFHELYPKARGPKSMRAHHHTPNSTRASDELRAIRSHLQRHRTSLWLLLPHTATFREAAVALVLRGEAPRLPSGEAQDRTAESLIQPSHRRLSPSGGVSPNAQSKTSVPAALREANTALPARGG